MAGRKKAGLKATKKRILETGRRIYAEVIQININRSTTVNGLHPWMLVLEYKDEYTGNKHIYKSKNIWNRPEESIIGTTVPIFIDGDNFNKYIVDLRGLEDIINNGGVVIHN